MYERRYPGPGLADLPPVVKNLLILNFGIYAIVNVVYFAFHYNLLYEFGLFYIKSDYFRPVQFVTNMFLHAGLWERKVGIMHIVGNMFALWMFGSDLERLWGPKRFLIYYFATGIGASILQSLVTYGQIQYLLASGNPLLAEALTYTVTFGASGAVFGILIGFGMMFPERQLGLLFIPFPIKAKYFVLIFAIAELYLGVQSMQGIQPADGVNIAHFAHLGGALFGYILIKAWGLRSVDYF